MTPEEHKQRHIELREALDELVSDWISHNPKKQLSKASMLEFMHWAMEQTWDPTPDAHLSEHLT